MCLYVLDTVWLLTGPSQAPLFPSPSSSPSLTPLHRLRQCQCTCTHSSGTHQQAEERGHTKCGERRDACRQQRTREEDGNGISSTSRRRTGNTHHTPLSCTHCEHVWEIELSCCVELDCLIVVAARIVSSSSPSLLLFFFFFSSSWSWWQWARLLWFIRSGLSCRVRQSNEFS